ncbi:hypothetical protein [Adhaeretor mobilis]|uniref:Uncharacterized protein n=1 Tax=Adhaeretor mobilis TaxID=1930276 RepID=A0A517MWH7_9BACT|nr:hypothetical protein [Adhaeretor mobilis]QDS99233.1 hypothetical protein HG15A2_25390 [Adhaeretor mobilis]
MNENKIALTQADLIPLEDFELCWRWRDPQYILLADEELSEITPLCPTAAQKVYSVARSFTLDSSFRLSSSLFRECVDCDTSGEPSDGRKWLERVTRSFDPSLDIVVTWSEELAVATKLWLFVKYWDDFCYPMSDDTTVFPSELKWAIQYWHEEHLYFGKYVRQSD